MDKRQIVSSASMSKNPPRYTHTENIKQYGISNTNKNKKERKSK